MTKRRDFIKTGMLGTAGITIGGMGLSSKSYASIIGANDRVNVAVIGIRAQGRAHINNYCSIHQSHNVRLKTLCDVDEAFFADQIKNVNEKTGFKPGTEWDLRKVLEDPEIDGVSIATPNHWHALATIWACQAGKHVYVEKPVCHNIFEGRKMVEAARKYNVRVQSGFQSRSSRNVISAIKFLHDGGIGDVYMARGLCFKPRDSFGIARDGEPPSTLHYDMWLGPAAWRPYNEKRGHYNWHWFWDTGNGDTGNQGPHQFDIARWGLNKSQHPVTVHSSGGVYAINPAECAQETPNTQISVYKYSDGKMLEFETRGMYTNGEASQDVRIGNIFYGTDGYLELSGGSWKAYKKREKDPFMTSKEAGAQVDLLSTVADASDSNHWGNFINAIRSGDNDTLRCDIMEGFYSSALPHLGNISYRLGRGLKFMGEYEKFADDPEANLMLTRNYRKPYVVPEEV